MNNYTNKIAITTGEPNGIGAEITIKALNALNLNNENVVLISNSKILDKNGTLNNDYEIIEIPYQGEVNQAFDSKEGGEFSFQSLKKACEIKPKAIITAPVSKHSMHLAGHFFNGQTEVIEHFLAKNGQKAEMLFVANNFRVLLLTRHIALKDIKITKELIQEKVKRLNEFFKVHTNIKKPKIGLCALNPHAGENGVIGTEENEIILPAIIELQQSGIDISEPISADTLLAKALNQYLNGKDLDYDCYISMYHDQGLIPIKAAAFDDTVNTTIGLDIIRTSPSHGTAYDIAGKDVASEASMISAIKLALNI